MVDPDLNEECPDGCACSEVCEGACTCAADCTCNFTCTGEDCTARCQGRAACLVTGATEDLTRVNCGGGGACELDCASAGRCVLNCRAGACLLRCPNDDTDCRMVCDAPRPCRDGVTVCGRACP